MGEFLGRFIPFEQALLVAAVVAALAAIGDLGRGDGPVALLLSVIIACACVGAAGGSRKRRLLGDRRPFGPIEELEHTHPLLFVAGSGAILGALFASTKGVVIGFLFAAAWIGSQLAVMQQRPARR